MQQERLNTATVLARLAQTDFSDLVLAALLKYPDLALSVLPHISHDFFVDRPKALIFRTLKDFVSRYGRTPSEEELKLALENSLPPAVREREWSAILRTLSNLLSLTPPGRDWLLANLDKAIKLQRFRNLFTQLPALLEQQDLETLQQQVLDIVYNSPFSLDGFSNLLDQPVSLADFDLQLEFNFPTRIYALDDYIQGCFRKELWVLMAPLNVGKSWACVHFAISALTSQKDVLFLTLEMSRDKVKQRFYQSIAGVVRPEEPEQLYRELNLYDPFEDTSVPVQVPTFQNLDEINASLNAFKAIAGHSKFVIRYHPSLSLSADAVIGEIEQFIARFGKPPDLLVVDSVCDLKVPRRQGNPDLGYAVRLLRAAAAKYDLTVLVTHQANRAALSAQVVTSEHTGTDISVMQVADVGLTLSQTKEEYRQGIMRLRVERARGARKWMTFKLFQNFSIGQFCIASIEEEAEQ